MHAEKVLESDAFHESQFFEKGAEIYVVPWYKIILKPLRGVGKGWSDLRWCHRSFVCVPRRTGFPRSRWLYNDSGAVGLLFFQLMSLGKFVDGDNDIFGYVFQLCIHSVSFLQKYGLFRGMPMFLFFFCSIYVSIWSVGRLIFGWIIMWLFFLWKYWNINW